MAGDASTLIELRGGHDLIGDRSGAAEESYGNGETSHGAPGLELATANSSSRATASIPLGKWSPLGLHRLLDWPDTIEHGWRKGLGLATGAGVTVIFALMMRALFTPGPGTTAFDAIDGNAYLVAGKNIAHYGQVGIHPENPFSYVASMWFRTADGWYYPKYPPGVPLLNAMAIWMGGDNTSAYFLQPACAVAGVLAIFLLGRALAGSFLGVMAAIILGSNATFLHQSMVPLSHMPALAFALWGIYLLFCWMRSGRLWQGALGGFLLGFITTIRYSEGLLGLCVAIAALSMVRWSNWRSYLVSSLPIIAWFFPVALLAYFNYKATGKLTSYDATNESRAFTIDAFNRKWEWTTHQLLNYGLFLVLSVGLLGTLLAPARSWRVGLLLLAWFWPGVLLCNAYYWGVRVQGTDYLRLFLTFFPAAILGSVWFISSAFAGTQFLVSKTHHRPIHVLLRILINSLIGAAVGLLGGCLLFAFMRTAFDFKSELVRQAIWENRQWGEYGALFVGHAGALMAFPRGRLAVGTAMFVIPVALLGFYVEMPELVHLNAYNANCSYNARMLHMCIDPPPGNPHRPDAIFFAQGNAMNDKLLMQMQFEGDGPWYSVNAFQKIGDVGGGMTGDRGQLEQAEISSVDPNQVTLVPRDRMRYMKGVFDRTTPEEFKRIGTQLISDALSNEVPIFVLSNPVIAKEFRDRLLKDGFDLKAILKWREPLEDPIEGSDSEPDSTRFAPIKRVKNHPPEQIAHWFIPEMRAFAFARPTFQVLQVVRATSVAVKPKN